MRILINKVVDYVFEGAIIGLIIVFVVGIITIFHV